jgi:hypothetical protein
MVAFLRRCGVHAFVVLSKQCNDEVSIAGFIVLLGFGNKRHVLLEDFFICFAVRLVFLRGINTLQTNTGTIASDDAVAVSDGLCCAFSSL